MKLSTAIPAFRLVQSLHSKPAPRSQAAIAQGKSNLALFTGGRPATASPARPAVAPRTQANIAQGRSDLSLFTGPRRPAPSPDDGFVKVDDGAAMQQTLQRYQRDLAAWRATTGERASSVSDCRSTFAPADTADAADTEDADGVDGPEAAEQAEAQPQGGADFGKALESAGKSFLEQLGAPFKLLGGLFGF